MSAVTHASSSSVSSVSSTSSSSASIDSNSSTSSLWKYVSNVTKTATDYVGLTGGASSPPSSSSSSSNLQARPSKRSVAARRPPSLYDEIGIECLNYLVSLLDSTRPRLNEHKVVREESLSVMRTEYVLLIEILSFLPFEEIVVMSNAIEELDNDKHYQLNLSLDYLIYNDLSGYEYIRECCCSGFSAENREIVWPYLVMTRFELEKYSEIFAKYQQHVDCFHHSIISKDIDRTLVIGYNGHSMLCEQDKLKLKHMLSVYCLLDPQASYVQGMNYIAAVILLAVHSNVAIAFAIFCHFMKRDLLPIYFVDDGKKMKKKKNKKNRKQAEERQYQSHAYCAGGRVSKSGQSGYGVRELYLPALPALIIGLLQFEKLIAKHLPHLFQYLTSQGIHTQHYASEWFLSMFCYILPLRIALRVMDIFIIDGWKMLHRAGLAILCRAQFEILSKQQSFDEILLMLKRKDLIKSLFDNDDELFIANCMQFPLSNAKLHESAVQLFTKSMIASHSC